jgi:hypothetical protein
MKIIRNVPCLSTPQEHIALLRKWQLTKQDGDTHLQECATGKKSCWNWGTPHD